MLTTGKGVIMAKIRSMRERNVSQELSNNRARFVDAHFVRDQYTGELAAAFVPETGHKAVFRLDRRQADKLRAFLNAG